MAGTPVAGQSQYFTFSALNLTNSLASEIRMQGKSGEIDISTIGNNWKGFIQGQAEATITCNGVWDAGTASAALDNTLFAALNAGGTKLWEYVPQGSASGNTKYTGNGILTAYEIGAPLNDKVGFATNIRVSGSVTRTTSA